MRLVDLNPNWYGAGGETVGDKQGGDVSYDNVYRSNPMMPRDKDWDLAVRHAHKVPGVKYLLKDPRNGPAEILEYVVDQYLDVVRRFEEHMRHSRPVLLKVNTEEQPK